MPVFVVVKSMHTELWILIYVWPRYSKILEICLNIVSDNTKISYVSLTGIAGHVAPMYIAECSPVSLRGTLSSGCQFLLVIGIFLGGVLGLSQLLGKIFITLFLREANVSS